MPRRCWQTRWARESARRRLPDTHLTPVPRRPRRRRTPLDASPAPPRSGPRNARRAGPSHPSHAAAPSSPPGSLPVDDRAFHSPFGLSASHFPPSLWVTLTQRWREHAMSTNRQGGPDDEKVNGAPAQLFSIHTREQAFPQVSGPRRLQAGRPSTAPPTGGAQALACRPRLSPGYPQGLWITSRRRLPQTPSTDVRCVGRMSLADRSGACPHHAPDRVRERSCRRSVLACRAGPVRVCQCGSRGGGVR